MVVIGCPGRAWTQRGYGGIGRRYRLKPEQNFEPFLKNQKSESSQIQRNDFWGFGLKPEAA